jgi:hypothetical protein
MKIKRYVAMAVTAGAFAAVVGSGAAAPPPEQVELVWGNGAAPVYAARPNPASNAKHGSIVELHWGAGARPQYVTVDQG